MTPRQFCSLVPERDIIVYRKTGQRFVVSGNSGYAVLVLEVVQITDLDIGKWNQKSRSERSFIPVDLEKLALCLFPNRVLLQKEGMGPIFGLIGVDLFKHIIYAVHPRWIPFVHAGQYDLLEVSAC